MTAPYRDLLLAHSEYTRRIYQYLHDETLARRHVSAQTPPAEGPA